MKLAASYNYFNGDEHLIASLRSIRTCVEVISIVWQETSNAGEPISQSARTALETAASTGLVDQVVEYAPDFTVSRRQNESNKRRLGLELARTADATHFLTLDADEFYRTDEFRAARNLIQESDWKSTSVSSFLHLKRPIYRAPDVTNVCFITKIEPKTEIAVASFPCPQIDSSRRMTAAAESHHHFPADIIAMYHMNFVRRDFGSKLRNSSTTAQDSLKEVERRVEDWTPGDSFEFPRKGSLEIDVVANEFGTFDPESPAIGGHDDQEKAGPERASKAEEAGGWLLCTHHMIDFSGSEVVLLELAEELLRRGIAVTISANFYDETFIGMALPPGVQFLAADEDPVLTDFRVVYCQHQSISKHMADQDLATLKSASRPIFIYNHLSPHEPFEFPGPFVEEYFGDIILANSAETRDSLQRFGKFFSRTRLFQNPAPYKFSSPRPGDPRPPKRVLSVTNHPPKELTEALDILEERGLKVTRIGRKTGQRQLSVDDLSLHDAVVTIGKTVQCAFRTGVPVYCYDHFAGPGWVTAANVEEVELTNFSGRSHPDKRGADLIAQEIANGPGDALIYPEPPERFCLEAQMDRLCALIDESFSERKKIELEDSQLQQMLIREQATYRLADKLYAERLVARKRLQTLQKELEDKRGSQQVHKQKTPKPTNEVQRHASWWRKIFGR